MATMTAPAGSITGGVATHLDVHVAAAVEHLGGVLGTASLPASGTGYRTLLTGLRSHGPLHKVGVEGTSSYGSALARPLAVEGVDVVEVARPNRQVGRRHGNQPGAARTPPARAAARAAARPHPPAL